MQISFENVDAAQPKHPAIVQRKFLIGFRFTDFGSDARRQSANRSQTARRLDVFAWLGRLGIGQIDAHHRRSLGKPVAFEHFFVETFLKMVRKIERQFLGAGDD